MASHWQFWRYLHPYITKCRINAKINKSECLQERLLPFIRKHHQEDKILFWQTWLLPIMSMKWHRTWTVKALNMCWKVKMRPIFNHADQLNAFGLCAKENMPIYVFKRKTWKIVSGSGDSSARKLPKIKFLPSWLVFGKKWAQLQSMVCGNFWETKTNCWIVCYYAGKISKIYLVHSPSYTIISMSPTIS